MPRLLPHLSRRIAAWLKAGVVCAAGVLMCGAVLGTGAARAQGSAMIYAAAPVTRASSHVPAIVPVKITRDDTTSVRLFHVNVQLSGNLTLANGLASFTEGPWLRSAGDTTSFWLIDNGGGRYTVDCVILGTACTDTLLTGTLFEVAVSSAADSGSGTVSLSGAVLRDCANADMTVATGDSASVRIDNLPPSVTLTSPNGGEFWVVNTTHPITWTATADDSVASVDLAWSSDGGATFPHVLATGLPNTGSWNWTIPAPPGTNARVRVTARDDVGNAAADASDASFTMGQWIIVASAGAHGSIAPPDTTRLDDGASQAFTSTGSPGYHVGDVLVDGVGVGAVTTYTFGAVHADHTISASFAANPPVAPIAALTAARVTTGNDADGTTKIAISWPARGPGETVAVYRAPYGNYPEYDDTQNAGSTPVLPTYPPPTPWQLTAVSAPGGTDEVATRDSWYYVAFVADSFGTRSPVSNMTPGALNYALGDVTNGVTVGQGDNHVDIADLTLLGAHYGLNGPGITPYAYLDVGPTTDHTVNGRPMTDNFLNFEDLVLFAINFQAVSAPGAAARPALVAASADELRLDLPVAGEAGAITARLQFRGTGAVQAFTSRVTWNPAVVAYESYAPGALLDEQDAVALSSAPGVVDVARLGTAGAGLMGEGEAAVLRFRRIAEGDPGIALASVDARSATNATVTLAASTVTPRSLPATTAFERVTPNPARGRATLSFALAQAGNVTLAIYGVDGRLVRTLLDGTRDAGRYDVAWDGHDATGGIAAPGVYYARLMTPQGGFTRTIAFLR